MGKSWDYRGTKKKSSFSQKKKQLAEYEDLASSGYLQKLSNKSRVKFDGQLRKPSLADNASHGMTMNGGGD